LTGSKIWLEEGKNIPTKAILSSPRVGVGYAEEDALLPLRFRIQGNPWISKAK
jgi:DNA-3-methyladenine glycosylase